MPGLFKISWRKSVFLISGCYGVAIFSAGGALDEIGFWSVIIWFCVALVGWAQAKLLSEMAGHLPEIAGGTAAYTHHAFKGRLRVFAFVSSWCYVIAWTPGIALNCLLICGIVNVFIPTFGDYQVPFAIVLILILYSINYYGLGKAILSSYIISLIMLIPMGALFYIGFQEISAGHLRHVFYLQQKFIPALFFKWYFVIAWTGYGVEMISSVVSETISSESYIRKLFLSSGVLATFAFTVIPLLMALVTPDWHITDPFSALNPLFQKYFGTIGSLWVGLLLITALLLSGMGFIIPTTRTVYQLSKDGLLPRFFGKINRYGSPTGSFFFDIGLNVFLLLLFKGRLLSLIAAANVAYILVFVMFPLAYYHFYRHHQLSINKISRTILMVSGMINIICVIIGPYLWGPLVFFTGWLLALAGFPLFFCQDYFAHKIRKARK